jgi:hypothetical protein
MTRRPSVATQLVDRALARGVALFHASDGEPFGEVPTDTHQETWAIRSQGFRFWLRQQFFRQTGATANAQAVEDALCTLESMAQFQGEEHVVHVRVAEREGSLYLDLADPLWRCVQITASGWCVPEQAPVRFRRPRGLQALPVPTRGGSLDGLRELLTIDDDGWRLVVGWVVGTLRPGRPFPVLALHGEQGTAKTTLAKMLRRLVDPNEADLRPCPREEYDLILAAKNGWIIGFDNVSEIKPWLSDVLCRVATGIGFGRRQLYTDGEEYLFSVKRPIVVNGIEDLAVRGDLVDRAIVLTLPRIEEDRRREEDELWPAFTAAHPLLLGALLTAVSGALHDLPSVQLDRKPRMADFARWVVAAEPALGWAAGSFLKSYRRNRSRAVTTPLEASLIVDPLRALLSDASRYEGTVGELLRELRARSESSVRDPDWPKDAIRLSSELRRLAPALRRTGIHVRFLRRTKAGRRVLVWARGQKRSASPQTTPRFGDVGDDGDDDSPAFSSTGSTVTGREPGTAG